MRGSLLKPAKEKEKKYTLIVSKIKIKIENSNKLING
jgi:hypothetical protein